MLRGEARTLVVGEFLLGVERVLGDLGKTFFTGGVLTASVELGDLTYRERKGKRKKLTEHVFFKKNA